MNIVLSIILRKRSKRYFYRYEKVIDKLLSNGYAEEFLENYKRYRNCESYCNTIRKVLEECTEQRGVNQFGIKTHAIYYDVNVQQNLRFNYKNRDIVAFLKRILIPSQLRMGIS